ncbi:MAG: DUF2905 domain-containing protein [Candidatus Manganitrophus sp.]|nr:DUF2905 domain-containing protein [Candidatus Manganitrophus sp.]
MADIGRILIFLGLILALLGGIVLLAGKIPGLGRLPGDILIQRRNVTFYFPIATSILISIVLSFIFWLLSRR